MKESLKKYFNRPAVAMLVLGLVAGVIFEHFVPITSPMETAKAVRAKDNEYQYINPLLFYNIPSEPAAFGNLLPQIQKTIDSFKASDKNANASIYLKNMNSGEWAGINTAEKYNPASLLKVVVMIAYFKEAETQPSILNRYLTYTTTIQKSFSDLPYDQATDLVLGQSYSTNDLISRMIISSDNGATYTLLNSINVNDLNEVYSALGIDNPADQDRSTYSISPGQYSYFFRILYNATYLDRDTSEKAMALLAKSNFTDGLSAGVPNNVQIAQKFGEFVSANSDNLVKYVELHDCGIIYYPNDDPYMLCVMTRGSNIDELKTLIKNISAEVYTGWEKRKVK